MLWNKFILCISHVALLKRDKYLSSYKKQQKLNLAKGKKLLLNAVVILDDVNVENALEHWYLFLIGSNLLQAIGFFV